ncbi:MAG: RNA polymerase sigma factor [Candidatus Kerfeldbacteria bacterium]
MNTTHAQLVDEGLAAAAQAGDESALSQLYDRHLTPLYRYIFRHVNHLQDAEDLTSDVMLRMVNSLPTYQRTASFRTWLYGIARHAIADFWRSRYKVREELVADFSGIGAKQDERFESEPADESSDVRHMRAQKVFEKLPNHYRDVLRYRFIEQRTVAETAEVMGMSHGNVKVLQYRALKKAAVIAKEVV